MDLQLTGKRAPVTGSSGGIGRAMAERLADEGAAVVIHGRDAKAIGETVEAIADAGGSATGVAADLGSPEGPADLAAEATRSLEGIDILVNNAGEYRTTTWESADPRDWEDLYRRNVAAAVGLIRALVPAMRERGWGRVIQIASGEATNPFATMPDYAATKAALVNLSVSLAKSLDRTGVTANTVSPGIVVTRGVERFYRDTAQQRGWGESWHEIERHVLAEVLDNPCGRLGRPEEVAGVVALLASPRADYVNASNWRIDGGSTACVN
jgi:NAD(P)-dependent dehydrogenase (short-subunit alcohol dehydrogenase family)